jgi:hypothetical protein
MTVDKNLFQSLLHRYASSSREDMEAVLALKAQYPYSQLLSTLAAKFVNDHQHTNWQQELQTAAIRSADRTVLKEVMDNEIDFTEKTEVKTSLAEPPFVPAATIIPSANEFVAPQEKKIVVYEADVALTHFEGTDVADQVLKDLEKLNVSKQNFEMLFVEYAEVKSVSESRDVAHSHDSVATADSVREKENAKNRKQRIVEIAKARQAAPSAAIESIEETKKKRNASPNDELIKEIITSKEELSPENDKQKEQIDIIDYFIQKQPSITSARDKQPAPVADLNPIKTGEFGDNIISETLVEILIKQGKKEKAVEVLKKLIWKYPQKKAYFASQIEELKK